MMEINNTPNRPVQPLASQDRQNKPELSPAAGRVAITPAAPNQTGARPEPVSANPPASAQVALSNSAVQMMSGGDQKDSFDASKVERVSREIQEGRFKVNAERVADRLIANTRELLANRDPDESR
ncbi:MAG: flagellar biosynthesis anti-sigma factor FlgM [Inhella sp.]|nr:flagellar biosynthesis anti-sigma factor FlgM [Inhella sp.]